MNIMPTQTTKKIPPQKVKSLTLVLLLLGVLFASLLIAGNSLGFFKLNSSASQLDCISYGDICYKGGKGCCSGNCSSDKSRNKSGTRGECLSPKPGPTKTPSRRRHWRPRWPNWLPI